MQFDLDNNPEIYWLYGSRNFRTAVAYGWDEAVNTKISYNFERSCKNSRQKGLTFNPIF